MSSCLLQQRTRPPLQMLRLTLALPASSACRCALASVTIHGSSSRKLALALQPPQSENGATVKRVSVVAWILRGVLVTFWLVVLLVVAYLIAP